MEGVFYKNPKEYDNRLDPITSYLEQLTHFIQLRKKCTKEEANSKAKVLLKKHFKDVPVKYFQRAENGDKVVENTTLLNYIYTNIKEQNILVPTFTSYVNSKFKESILSKFIAVNVRNRAVAKGESQAAKARGETLLAVSKNNEQNNMKTRNNSVSGLFGQKGSILYNPTAHNTLTSVTRTVTSLTNACNERCISGNRYLPRPTDVHRLIVYESTYTNVEEVKRVCYKFGLHLPTTEEVVSVLKRSSDLYFKDDGYYEEHIVPLLNDLTPYHRAAICYVGDLYTLRELNSDFTRQLFQRLIKKYPNTGETIEDPGVFYGIDSAILYFAHTIYSYELTGMGKDYKLMNENGLAKPLHMTCMNIIEELQQYKEFFNAFFMTSIVPINSHRLRNMRRRTVVLSDTDSSGFTLDGWSTWWGNGDYKVDAETLGLAGAVTYIALAVIVNQLSILSKSLNVEEEKLRILAMKNEYLWTTFIPAEVSKHYYAYTTIEEGNVFRSPSVEIKGVHLKNSAVPEEIILEGEKIMEDILAKLHVNEKVNLHEIIRRMIGIENKIIDSVMKGEAIYLKRGRIKEASAYAQGPDKSPYQRHLLWVDVFEPKYGEIEEPVYDIVKFPTIVNNRTAIKEWLESIQDVELAGRLEKWLTDYKKTSLPTIYLNSSHVQGVGIPEEIASVINVKQIVFDSTLQLRVILETLGLILNEDLLIKEQFDVSSGLALPKKEYTWSNKGNGYRVDSKGDKRFSAFYAKLPNGMSIEEYYQTKIKGYPSIKEGKGKKAISGISLEEQKSAYLKLWKLWAKNNPVLMEELRVLAGNANYQLVDVFAHNSSGINQAWALSEILNGN